MGVDDELDKIAELKISVVLNLPTRPTCMVIFFNLITIVPHISKISLWRNFTEL